MLLTTCAGLVFSCYSRVVERDGTEQRGSRLDVVEVKSNGSGIREGHQSHPAVAVQTQNEAGHEVHQALEIGRSDAAGGVQDEGDIGSNGTRCNGKQAKGSVGKRPSVLVMLDGANSQ